MKTLRALLALLLLADVAHAAPVVTAIAGTISTGSTLDLFGTGFPAKTRGKLFLYADAQAGTLGANSLLSFITTLSAGNMTVVSDSNVRWGSHTFRSSINYTSAQRSATLRPTSVVPVTYSTRILISWWEKSNITYLPFNWKAGVRWWVGVAGSPNYPSHYLLSLAGGSSSTSDIRKNIEFPTSSTGLGSGYGFPNSTWRRITVLYQMNSTLGSSDGRMIVYKNNTLVRTDTNLKFNESATSPAGRTVGAFANMPYFQHTIANDNWTAGTNWWVTDLALDDSWGRYEIGNASTYAACTQLELQPFTLSNANRATLTLRLGTLTGTKWLYVCDNDNNCNTNGFQLNAVAAVSPGLDSLTPANGPAEGGTVVVAAGSGFASGAQISVGGVDASGENVNSALSMTFTTPAGPPGSCVDVTVFNPDTLNATLTNGFCYDPAGATIDPVTEVFPWANP